MVSEVEPIRVLFVEDEPLVREWVAESLSAQGFAVHAVTNATDALRRLAVAPVDVLFTDINLPGAMDGAILARRARELLPGLAVVYASARANVLEPKVRVPGSVFVPKPYVPALIGKILADTLRSMAARAPA